MFLCAFGWQTDADPVQGVTDTLLDMKIAPLLRSSIQDTVGP
jgi:hypothetical protein